MFIITEIVNGSSVFSTLCWDTERNVLKVIELCSLGAIYWLQGGSAHLCR